MAEKPRILVVDDDDELRSLMLITMSKGGFEADEARDGIEALEKLPVFKPHVIALDLMMPRMDGREFLKELEKRDIPANVVIMTAYWEASTDGKLRDDKWVMEVYQKPLRYTTLARDILGLLVRRKVVPDTVLQDML